MAMLKSNTQDFAVHATYTETEEPAWDVQDYFPLTSTLSSTLSTDETYFGQFDERYAEFPQKSTADRTFSRGDTRVVLSLDGGGVRGLSTLLILRSLMKMIATIETNRWPVASTSADSPQIEKRRVAEEFQKLRRKLDRGHGSVEGYGHSEDSLTANFLPCHYFDYIAGTSTGGLIAAMLGRLWMSVDRTLKEFNDLTERVYGLRYRSKVKKAKLKLRLGRSPDEKVKDLMRARFGTESLQSDRDRCKTIICSFEQISDSTSSRTTSSLSPFLFRSYTLGQSSSTAASYSVSDVLRASGCSPYYPSFVRLDKQHEFFDAGFQWTNPTGEVFEELQVNGLTPPTSILSIGCGYVKPKPHESAKSVTNQSRMTKTSVRLNKALWTNSEKVHGFMEEKSKELAIAYHRLNVPLDLSTVTTEHRDSWREEVRALRKEIEAVTQEYLSRTDVRETLEDFAKTLVELRRERSLTPGWEAFAFGIRYQCTFAGECAFKDRKMSRDELEAHLRDHHGVRHLDHDDDAEIRMLVDQGRVRSDELEGKMTRS